MSTILYTKSLSKVYGVSDNQVSALDNVTIDFEEGSFTAITGRSGSGKSTLLHLLGGLDSPTNGEVFLENKRIYDLPDRERTIMRRRRIGFVFQFYNLMPELTAYENIVLPINLDGRNPDKIYLNEIIEMLGLKDRLLHYAGELSGGQQQRVAIARALATKPAVVLADEPTGNLDGKSGTEVLDLLRLTKKRFNQTLVMVTHDLKIAEGADRIIKLADGRIDMN